MASPSRKRYRAYFTFADGDSVPIRSKKHRGMLTFAAARALASRTSGCTTVGFFSKGSHHITTVWAKKSCGTKVRRKAARGG